MLRPSPNHGTQRLPNDDDDEAHGVLPVFVALAQLEFRPKLNFDF